MRRLEATLERISGIDYELMEAAQRKLDNLTKPRGSLGKLEELAKRVVGITGCLNPKLNQKIIFTMAGDHGVVEEGVSLFPQEVTSQMVYNFMRGGAGVNVLARHVGAEVVVVDMGVASSLKRDLKVIQKKIGYGTKNMVKGPSMSRGEAEKSIEAGIEVFEDVGRGADIIGIGDMGIGNTTSSSAILAALTGEAVEKVTGRGTGINDEMLKRKIEVVKRALEVNMPNPEDPLDVLAKVGGFEIGGLAGVVLAGASSKIPVVIDGFISGAAALIAIRLESKVREYLFASHCSAEIGHRVMLQWMGLEPLLDLNLRLGEGTGAALGISLVEAGCKILNEMASFDEAGVSGELT